MSNTNITRTTKSVVIYDHEDERLTVTRYATGAYELHYELFRLDTGTVVDCKDKKAVIRYDSTFDDPAARAKLDSLDYRPRK